MGSKSRDAWGSLLKKINTAAARRRRCRRSRNRARLDVQILEERLALTTLPAGFSETLITTGSNLSSPTAMEFSPTGQVWVLEKGGLTKLVRSDGTTHTALTLTVHNSGERGLLGITFDSNYDGAGPNTDYIYLYYTTPRVSPTDPANNRLSRFTVTGAGTTTPTLSSQLILRDLPPEDEDNDPATDGDTNHNGGAIHFGPGGKLYVAVGDHNYDTVGQASHVSQITTTPFGKILRLNLDGSNPSDNPFYTGSASDWQGSIWALGLRNPYTFSFESGTNRMFINDVGEGAWEEINEGVVSGNYGWAGSGAPVWEGFESPPPTWANYHDPLMAYDHSAGGVTPQAGVAITGGVFYPANSQFGSQYAGKYFYADYGGNFIRIFDPANPGSVGTPDTSVGFATNPTTSGPVDLKVDSAGNLYYLAIGGEIYRISATSVAGRQLFYNQSVFDGNNAAAGAADDGAIASDKTAYLPGSGTTTFASVSSYTRGINGIMVDISGSHGTITANDFIFKVGNNNTPSGWATATGPTSVTVRTGAGVGGSDRVELLWANGAVQNTWLQVVVKGRDALGGSNANTGLVSSDVFYFGSAPADSGSADTGGFQVTPSDEISARNDPHGLGNPAPITNVNDFSRDGFVNSSDQISARNLGTSVANQLKFLVVGAGGPFAPEAVQALPALGGSSQLDSAVASALAASSAPASSASSLPLPLADPPRREEVRAAHAAYFNELAGNAPRPAGTTIAATAHAGCDQELDEDLLDSIVTGP